MYAQITCVYVNTSAKILSVTSIQSHTTLYLEEEREPDVLKVLEASATRGLTRCTGERKITVAGWCFEVYSGIARARKAACCHYIKDINKKSWLAIQAKVLGTVKNPGRSWAFGLVKITTQITRSGLCSWHRATSSLTFGWESANSSSSSGLRAGWFQEASAMGFRQPAAPLLPGWLSSTLRTAFPSDRKKPGCYMYHSFKA